MSKKHNYARGCDPGYTFTPNPIDEPIHDAHAEIGFGQRPNTEPLLKYVSNLVGDGGGMRGGAAETMKASTVLKHDLI